MGEVGLRAVADEDLDALFAMMRDPVAVRMAAFTPPDPDDRAAFDERVARHRKSPEIRERAVTVDRELVGSIASFVMDGETEITYWIERAWWRRGVAGRALSEFLREVTVERPLFARAASDNAGSLAVLRRAGFRVTGARGRVRGGAQRRDRGDDPAAGVRRATPPRQLSGTALRLGCGGRAGASLE